MKSDPRQISQNITLVTQILFVVYMVFEKNPISFSMKGSSVSYEGIFIIPMSLSDSIFITITISFQVHSTILQHNERSILS